MTRGVGHLLTGSLRLMGATIAGWIVFVTFLSVGACSTSDGDSPTGPIALYQTGDTRDGAGALLAGRLQLLDACVVFEASAETLVPVFPDGTEWDSERTSVLLPGGATELTIGDEIQLGGGHVDDANDSMSIPAGCPTHLDYYVVTP